MATKENAARSSAKVRGQNRYLCSVYETRPQVCRDYVPWSGKENDICEVVT